MSQVNMLAIDLAKSVDSQAVSTKSANKDDGQTSLFSDVMAKHQEKESGNNSQQSGKINNEKAANENATNEKTSIKSTETDADKKSINDNNAAVENDSVKQAEHSDDETSQTNTQDGEVDYESRDVILAEKNSSDPSKSTDDIAQKLLSFILASDEVSTDHVDAKAKGEDKVSVDGEKTSAINLSAKDKAESKTNQLASQLESAATSSDEPTSTNVENVKVASNAEAGELKNSQGKVNQANVEASPNDKVGANLSLSATAKSVKEAILVDSTSEADAIESKVDARLQSADIEKMVSSPINNAVESIEEDVNNELAKQKAGNIGSVVDKLTQENKQSIKLNIDKTDHIQLSTPQSAQLAAQAANAVDTNVAEVNNEDFKVANKNDPSLERFINQASTSRTSADNQSNLQHGQQGQQQNQQQGQSASDQSQHFSKNESEQVKDIQQVLAKNEQETDFTEKLATNITEKNALQSSLHEATNQQILSQQSLNYAEEQAIQSNIAKASADSMSVQSAKTAINIQAETISINRKDFTDAVKDKVMVMINQKIKQLEIRLDPPELGSMHVKLNMQNEQAAVNFVVQNQQAKEALEQNMDKLKDMLAQSGVDVGDANIEQQNQQAQEGGEVSQHQGNRQGSDGQHSEDEITISAANLYKASASGVDYYA